MHKKQLFLCTKNNFSSHINTNKKLHLAALMSVVFLCVYTFLFLNPLPAYMDNTKATPAITSSELNVTTSDISIDTSVDSPSGTFRESSPANISVTTDNYSGYTLSIDSSLDNEYANKLVNSNETAVINSISSASTESDFTSNTWGIKPSKLEGDDNTNFIPVPSSDNTVTIDTTSGSSIEPTIYTMSIAAKVDYSLPADTYSNTYVVIAVGNPTLYTIEYDKNVDGDVSNMPATQASDTEDASITLSSTTPTSAKKYKFLSWCDGTVTDNDGIPSCDGTVYDPGDEYDLDQTTDNHVVLYGMWDRTATLVPGQTFSGKLRALANYSVTNIEAIKTADSLPDGFVAAQKNIVSMNDSPDVYAWWDNTNNAKTIYIYTDAGRIKTNSDSSYLLYTGGGYAGFYKLSDISGLSDWDTSNTTDMSYAFSDTNIPNMNDLRTGQRTGRSFTSWDMSNITNMEGTFYECDSVTELTGVSNWDVSNVINMKKMFAKSSTTTNKSAMDISGLSDWDTSNVEDMSYMFHDSSKKGNLIGASSISNWDTSSVKDMSYMFYGITTGITDLDDLTTGVRQGNDYVSWDVSNVENLSNMFYGNSSLTDISGISNWNTSKVKDLSYMFYGVKIIDLDDLTTGVRQGNDYVSWDVSNVENLSYMFYSNSSLTDISGISNWNTSNVKDMNNMFFGVTKITDLDDLTTGVRQDNDYVSWDVSNVESMERMFYGDTSITDISGISNWNTSNAKNIGGMFYGVKITDLDDLTTGVRQGNDYVSWDVSNVENMGSMFDTTTVADISGISNWNTSKVKYLTNMFANTKITDLDALTTGVRQGNDYVSWDVSNVESMAMMFYFDSSLTDISGISNWNTSKVKSMNGMFRGVKITDLDDLTTGVRQGNDYVSWDTSNVESMVETFSSRSLTDISGISNWNTSKVKSMNSMFANVKITDLDDLTTGVRQGNDYVSWDVSKVESMGGLFGYNTVLTSTSGISNWDTSSVTYMSGMFRGGTSLVDISGVSNWNTSKVTNMSYMFDATGVTDLNALVTGQREGKDYVSWDVSKVTNMGNMFNDCTSLTDSDDLDPLNSWTVNASLNKSNMFNGISDTVLRPTWY